MWLCAENAMQVYDENYLMHKHQFLLMLLLWVVCMETTQQQVTKVTVWLLIWWTTTMFSCTKVLKATIMTKTDKNGGVLEHYFVAEIFAKEMEKAQTTVSVNRYINFQRIEWLSSHFSTGNNMSVLFGTLGTMYLRYSLMILLSVYCLCLSV